MVDGVPYPPYIFDLAKVLSILSFLAFIGAYDIRFGAYRFSYGVEEVENQTTPKNTINQWGH